MKSMTLVIAVALIVKLSSAQWIQLQNPYPYYNDTLREVYFIDQDHGFLGDNWYEGHLMGTLDGGNNWFYELSWLQICPTSITFSDENNGWLISKESIWKTSDGGLNFESWELMETPDIWGPESIYFTDSLNGWICTGHWGWMGDRSEIYATSDGGLSWIRSHADNGKNHDIFFINDSTGWSVGGSSVVYTKDKGDTWNNGVISTLHEFRAVRFIDENIGCVVGESGSGTGVIFKSFDGGVTWEQKFGVTIPPLYDLTFTDTLNGWAVGNNGTILHTGDAGETWEFQDSGTSADLRSVCFTDLNDGWVCGTSGTLLCTNNGGTVDIYDDFMIANSIKIFPNPTTDHATLSFDLIQKEPISISIISNHGKELQQLHEGSRQKGQFDLDCAHFSPGIYLLRIQIGNEMVTWKLIKR